MNNSFDYVRYIIQRFELNDPTSPTYYIVGFRLQCDVNQRNCYVETTVDYKECNNKNDNEICLIAFNKIKTKIHDLCKELLQKNFILGSEFVPPKE